MKYKNISIVGFLLVVPVLATSFDWPQFKGYADRSGRAYQNVISGPLQLMWKTAPDTERTVQYSSPIAARLQGVAGSEFIVSTKNSGNANAFFSINPVFDLAGNVFRTWSQKSLAGVYSSPAYGEVGPADDPSIFVSSTDGKLYKYAAGAGTFVWEKPLNNASFSSPLFIDQGAIDYVVVGSNSGEMFCFNADTGADAWSVPFQTEGYVIASPLFDALNNAVIIPSLDGYLYWISLSTGLLIEKKQVGPTRATPAFALNTDPGTTAAPNIPLGQQPIAASGVIVNVNNDGTITAWDSVTRAKGFEIVSGKAASASPAIAVKPNDSVKKMVVAFEDGDVHHFTFSNFNDTPTQDWSKNLAAKIYSSPMIVGGHEGEVHVAVTDGNYYILNMQTGATVQTIAVSENGAGIHASPALMNNLLYVATNNGQLRVYGAPVDHFEITGPDPIGFGTNIYTVSAVNVSGTILPFSGSVNLTINSTSAIQFDPSTQQPIQLLNGTGQFTINNFFLPVPSQLVVNDTINPSVSGSLVINAAVVQPPPAPLAGYQWYWYFVVDNRSFVETRTNTTVQISDGTGFVDTVSRIPSKMDPDGSDIRIVDNNGLDVEFDIVTNPQNINTIIRIKIDSLLPGERKIYMMAFGNPGVGFPAGYDSTAYLNEVYNFGDSFEGAAFNPAIFGNITGGVSVSGGQAHLPGGEGVAIVESDLFSLNSQYGVRYELTSSVEGAYGAFHWGFKNLAGELFQANKAIGGIGAIYQTSAGSNGQGFQIPGPPPPGNRKFFASKVNNDTMVAGVDSSNLGTPGEDFGTAIGLGGPNPIGLNVSYPFFEAHNLQATGAEVDRLVGWTNYENHPTAVLLDENNVPQWWIDLGFGLVTNDPVTETAWVGFPSEISLNIAPPPEVTEISNLIDPVDIAIGSSVFVLENSTNQIVEYDFELNYQGVYFASLSKPAGIAYDESNGWIWIADTGNRRVLAVDSSGDTKVVLTGNAETFVEPTGIEVASTGEVYVVDAGLAKVFAFDDQGQEKWSLGGLGYEIGRMSRPNHVALDEKNRLLYVSDSGNERVAVLDTSGYQVRTFPRASQVPVMVGHLNSVAVDAAGNLFVVDRDKGRIMCSTSNGDFIGATDTTTYNFVSPVATVVDNFGTWWIVDNAIGKVYKYSASHSEAAGGEGEILASVGNANNFRGRDWLPADKDLIAVPNPAKNVATAAFWLEEAGSVRLMLFNLAGENVYREHLGDFAPGEHHHKFNLEKFASGIYFLFYQVDTRYGYKTKASFKMAVVK